MLEYIKGILVEATPQKVVVENGGLAYALAISLSSYAQLPLIGTAALFYTVVLIREDSHRYFGFMSQTERNLFHTLSHLSGIGPKTALALLGHMEPHSLERAILEANVPALSRVPGIGKKKAERLVVELRDRLGNARKTRSKLVSSQVPGASQDVARAEERGQMEPLFLDALQALIGLGYPRLRAQQALEKALPLLHEQSNRQGQARSLANWIKAALQVNDPTP